MDIFKSDSDSDDEENDDEEIEEQEDQSEGELEGEDESCIVSLGEWVLVKYDNKDFPGEVVNIIGSEFEVNVMHRSGAAFWRWPEKDDHIFYNRADIIKQLTPPQVAGSRGQFKFEGL